MQTCTWATVNDLPNELLLTIIPLLPLKSLIAVQGVCRHWRTLVHEAHILPARRQLLEVFCAVVSSPTAHTRPRVSAQYCESDREEYLRFLDWVLGPRPPAASLPHCHLLDSFLCVSGGFHNGLTILLSRWLRLTREHWPYPSPR